jgi:hypothetical protein
MDPVTTAILLVSFDPVILSFFCQTKAKACSVHNCLDSLAEIVIVFLIVSQALLISISQHPIQSCEAISDLTHSLI